jgi:hypothetical protein
MLAEVDALLADAKRKPPVNKPVIEAVPCVTLFPCIIQRPEGTRPMASIEIIIRDDEGRIIGKKHYDDEEFDLGSATFHEIEGAVETLKQKPYPRSNVPC